MQNDLVTLRKITYLCKTQNDLVTLCEMTYLSETRNNFEYYYSASTLMSHLLLRYLRGRSNILPTTKSLHKMTSGVDPGFGQGGPQLLRPKVADIAEQSS